MLPGGLGDRGPVFLDDILKGWLPGPWERHSQVGRRCIHISEGQRKDL